MTMRLSETERGFQQAVIQLAKFHHWRVHHGDIGRGRSGKWLTPQLGDKGFPDLVLSRPGRLIVAELKVGRNKLTPEQGEWLALMSTVPGVEACIWRPEKWAEIERTLAPGPRGVEVRIEG